MAEFNKGFGLKTILDKARDNKKSIKRVLRLKRNLEQGSYLQIALDEFLKDEEKLYGDKSLLAEMKTIGGVQ